LNTNFTVARSCVEIQERHDKSGAVAVKATQAGNDNYNSVSMEQTFDVELVLGLEDTDNLVSISPNPATNVLLIQAPNMFKSISLSDMLGRDIVSALVANETTSIEIGHLPRGMYIVRLTGNDQSLVTRKVILR